MSRISLTGVQVQRIAALQDQGYRIKDIALDVGLSPKFVGRLLKNGIFISRYGQAALFRSERQPHPGKHPCMLAKKLWPKCSHGEHCYLAARCEAWANFNHERDAVCGFSLESF